MTSDNRREAGRQRRAAAARQGMTTRSYPPGAGRNRGLGPPRPEPVLTVVEAAAQLAADMTVEDWRHQLEQEG